MPISQQLPFGSCAEKNDATSNGDSEWIGCSLCISNQGTDASTICHEKAYHKRTNTKNNVFKSIGVVLLGFMAGALLSVMTDFLLESIGVLSSPDKGLFITWQIILVLAYRGIYTVFTGALVAKLAPNKPLQHALFLAGIGVVLTVLATLDPEFASKAPLWFPYTLAAITIPCTWLGVRIALSWNDRR